MQISMDRPVLAVALCCLIMLVIQLSHVSSNSEGDALNALKTNLVDPNGVLRNWDATLVNPCTWYNITCNSGNSVVRIDLEGANLSGQLVPQLGGLSELQYLVIARNNISGNIPSDLGNLTNLVSLELNMNNLNGSIPDSLGKLQKLSSLRLNNNDLSGHIPMSLTTIASLQVLDLSNNNLTGPVPVNGSFALFTPASFANYNNQSDTSTSPTNPSSSPVGNKAIKAISGGVAAGIALFLVVCSI